VGAIQDVETNGMDPSSPYGIDVPDWKCRPPVNREEESA